MTIYATNENQRGASHHDKVQLIWMEREPPFKRKNNIRFESYWTSKIAGEKKLNDVRKQQVLVLMTKHRSCRFITCLQEGLRFRCECKGQTAKDGPKILSRPRWIHTWISYFVENDSWAANPISKLRAVRSDFQACAKKCVGFQIPFNKFIELIDCLPLVLWVFHSEPCFERPYTWLVSQCEYHSKLLVFIELCRTQVGIYYY